MKQIVIFPPWNPWLGNQLFEGGPGIFCSGAFRSWRRLAAASGYRMDTWDVVPPEQADLLWFMDLPRRRAVFETAVRQAPPGTPKVLQVLESPLLFPANFVAANHAPFDAVATYASGSGKPYFQYGLPVTPAEPEAGKSFADRRLSVMINTNRVEGWWATRKEGLAGLPGLGNYFSGWRPPPGHWLRPGRGELYSWRRTLVQVFEESPNDDFDLYGGGWRGEAVSWFPGKWRSTAASWRPGHVDYTNKIERLAGYRFSIAVENYRGCRGYISEKLFDALIAGTVPVYLGEETITETVPAGAFVDVRRFPDQRALVDYLRQCPEAEWARMREAGAAFLRSPAFLPFTDGAFAERMMAVVREMVEPNTV